MEEVNEIVFMKFVLVLLILLLPASGAADEKISKEKFESQGKQRTYYLFVPDSAKSASSVSLVVLLHGSGRNGLSLVEKWKEVASKEGFIIVGPDASNGESWRMPEDAPEFIHELVEMLITKYSVEPHHIYLFGHSAGAVLALNLAMLESEYFAAVAVHAGAWRTQQEISVVDQAKRKTPLKIIVGDQDNFFPLAAVKATESILKEGGFPIDVAIMKGHNHWYYDLAPDINRTAWEFLKQNSLAADRRHVSYNFGAGDDGGAPVNQINVLRLRAQTAMQQFYAKEDELRGKDFIKDKAAVAAIARTQLQALVEGTKLLREVAAMAERASKMKIPPNKQQYFSLVATASIKRAESMDLMRQRSELLLTDEDSSSINSKRTELVHKIDALNDEAEALERKAQKLVGP
jgi:predicted esterase